MPPQTSVTLPDEAAVVRSPATSSQYSAERLVVIKLMAVMTALAVALVAVATTWFTELDALSSVSDDLWAAGSFRLYGGAIGILALAGSMLVVWVRLVKHLARMDWNG